MRTCELDVVQREMRHVYTFLSLGLKESREHTGELFLAFNDARATTQKKTDLEFRHVYVVEMMVVGRKRV